MRGCHAGRAFIVQPSDHARFTTKHTIVDSGCWEWCGRASDGYGRFSLNRKDQLAHRVAYVIANGSIPDGMLVMHTCDNGMCVNPNHLWAGTQADNLADMRRKGRAPNLTGPRKSKAVCKYGHPLTDATTVRYGRSRQCLRCRVRNSVTSNRRLTAERSTNAVNAMLSHVQEQLPHSFEDLVAISDRRRAHVFCWNYGVFDHEPKTLTEIGVFYGITRERARQLCNDVLDTLGIPRHRRQTAHAA